MRVLLVFAAVFVLGSCETGSEELDILAGISGAGHISLEVEHSFDNGKSFVPRGTLNIHSLRSSSASFDSAVTTTDSINKALQNLCNVSHNTLAQYEPI